MYAYLVQYSRISQTSASVLLTVWVARLSSDNLAIADLIQDWSRVHLADTLTSAIFRRVYVVLTVWAGFLGAAFFDSLLNL